MNAIIKNSRGSIVISSYVLANIAGSAATSCYGVVGMSAKSGKDGIAKILKRENMSKGIKITIDQDKIDILLNIVVEYGINISTICESIKNNVKYQVENATGLTVTSVSVSVDSIRVN